MLQRLTQAFFFDHRDVAGHDVAVHSLLIMKEGACCAFYRVDIHLDGILTRLINAFRE
jgi:hypothetical protein